MAKGTLDEWAFLKGLGDGPETVLWCGMIDASKSLSQTFSLFGLLNVKSREPRKECASRARVFAERLRDQLCEIGGTEFDFAEPVCEGDECDIAASAVDQRFVIEVAFLESEGPQCAEWVVTILPEADLGFFQPTKGSGNTLDSVSQLVESALAGRNDVTIVTPSNASRFAQFSPEQVLR